MDLRDKSQEGPRLMSARPANCGRIAAITLPIAAIPTAPPSAASATALASTSWQHDHGERTGPGGARTRYEDS